MTEKLIKNNFLHFNNKIRNYVFNCPVAPRMRIFFSIVAKLKLKLFKFHTHDNGLHQIRKISCKILYTFTSSETSTN